MSSVTTPCAKSPSPLQRLAAVLLMPLRLRQRRPLLLRALMAQVPRQRTVHQVAQLRSLAASWLAAPDLQALDLALHQQMQLLALQAMQAMQTPRPRSPKSSSSSAKMGPSTMKPRR